MTKNTTSPTSSVPSSALHAAPQTAYTWAGRFSEPMSELVKRYTASIDFDQRLWRQDIRGSLAHARMLARQNIISAADLADIERGMNLTDRKSVV